VALWLTRPRSGGALPASGRSPATLGRDQRMRLFEPAAIPAEDSDLAYQRGRLRTRSRSSSWITCIAPVHVA
jgi:hypothetical protein